MPYHLRAGINVRREKRITKRTCISFNTNNQVYQYKFLWVKYEKTGLKYKPHFFFLCVV